MESLLGAFVLGFITILTVNFVFAFAFLPSRHQKQKHVSVQVLVLGDVGRSPRMQYHALSIAKHGGSVQLIGYHGVCPIFIDIAIRTTSQKKEREKKRLTSLTESALLPELASSPNVRVCALPTPPAALKSVPFIIAGPLKVIWQVASMFWVLSYDTEPSGWLLVQNPPSIPTLAVAALACTLRNTRLMIDWHNYGWTILAGTRGASHPFVRISKYYESFFGRLAPDANLTVTHAMRRQLQRSPYNIKSPIVAMHDRPAAIFQPITTSSSSSSSSVSSRHAVLSNILETEDFADAIVSSSMRLLVSSTSWTPDEDFSILLDALVQYGSSSSSSEQHVPLLVIITGRGPQKEMYLSKIASLAAAGHLPEITIRTAFLSFDNYARLLAAADLGICLHMSSSGVDLPMKVVDMFGAGLPVLAYSAYESFGELVREGENGCGFETSAELAAGVARLLDPADEGRELARLKAGAVQEGARRWDEEWDEKVKPVLGFTEA